MRNLVGLTYREPFRAKLTDSSGLGGSLQQVILGRLLAGVGGAGINCLVSIVIAGKLQYFDSNIVISNFIQIWYQSVKSHPGEVMSTSLRRLVEVWEAR